MKELTVCALFYGDYLDLAKRCLGSIEALPQGWEHVRDFRLGMNQVSRDTEQYVHEWAQRMAEDRQIPCRVYTTTSSALKYPMMRKLFFNSETLAKYTMWFDDDSYLENRPEFWELVVKKMKTADLIGQHWYKDLSGSQQSWIADQPWGETRCGWTKVKFCTGGWWTIRSAVLEKYDYPWRALRHKGGDMMLGALCLCQKLRMEFFDTGVRINADSTGAHSKAARRGVSVDRGPETDIGRNYQGILDSCEHQNYMYTVRRYS